MLRNAKAPCAHKYARQRQAKCADMLMKIKIFLGDSLVRRCRSASIMCVADGNGKQANVNARKMRLRLFVKSNE